MIFDDKYGVTYTEDLENEQQELWEQVFDELNELEKTPDKYKGNQYEDDYGINYNNEYNYRYDDG